MRADEEPGPDRPEGRHRGRHRAATAGPGCGQRQRSLELLRISVSEIAVVGTVRFGRAWDAERHHLVHPALILSPPGSNDIGEVDAPEPEEQKSILSHEQGNLLSCTNQCR